MEDWFNWLLIVVIIKPTIGNKVFKPVAAFCIKYQLCQKVSFRKVGKKG